MCGGREKQTEQFTEECVMRTEKHVVKKCLQMG